MLLPVSHTLNSTPRSLQSQSSERRNIGIGSSYMAAYLNVIVTAHKSPILPGGFSSHFTWVKKSSAGTLNSSLQNLQQMLTGLSRAHCSTQGLMALTFLQPELGRAVRPLGPSVDVSAWFQLAMVTPLCQHVGQRCIGKGQKNPAHQVTSSVWMKQSRLDTCHMSDLPDNLS